MKPRRLLILSSLVLILVPLRLASAGSFVIFSNTAPITIRDNTTASPYPSAITVSGLPATTTTK